MHDGKVVSDHLPFYLSVSVLQAALYFIFKCPVTYPVEFVKTEKTIFESCSGFFLFYWCIESRE